MLQQHLSKHRLNISIRGSTQRRNPRNWYSTNFDEINHSSLVTLNGLATFSSWRVNWVDALVISPISRFPMENILQVIAGPFDVTWNRQS